MNKNINDKQELIELEEKIKIAEESGAPIEEFVLREIEILQQTIDIFIKEKTQEGLLNDIAVAEAEIRQYSAMRQLAVKINYPTEKYTEHIKEVQCRLLGENNWKTFFGN